MNRWIIPILIITLALIGTTFSIIYNYNQDKEINNSYELLVNKITSYEQGIVCNIPENKCEFKFQN